MYLVTIRFSEASPTHHVEPFALTTPWQSDGWNGNPPAFDGTFKAKLAALRIPEMMLIFDDGDVEPVEECRMDGLPP